MTDPKKMTNLRLLEEMEDSVERLCSFCEMSGGTPEDQQCVHDMQGDIDALKAEVLSRMKPEPSTPVFLLPDCPKCGSVSDQYDERKAIVTCASPVCHHEFPLPIPAAFKNTDPIYVDDTGIYIGPFNLVRHKFGDLTMHLRRSEEQIFAAALCDTACEDLVEFVGRASDSEKTFKVCAKCRALHKEKSEQ